MSANDPTAHHPTAHDPADDSHVLVARVLHRDASVLIIDKPAGVPVHAGPQSAVRGPAPLDSGFDALRFGLPRRPELAHRLDRDTSGCLALGRHRRALDRLRVIFQTGAAEKTYLAVVEGGPEDDKGEIDLALARRDPSRGWWMKVDPSGMPSLTRWRVLGRDAGAGRAALALTPVTGRTHQLRVHCAAAGWPILGDAVYGRTARFGGEVLHLHAARLVLPFDPKRAPIRAEAPVPPHMSEALAACGASGLPPG